MRVIGPGASEGTQKYKVKFSPYVFLGCTIEHPVKSTMVISQWRHVSGKASEITSNSTDSLTAGFADVWFQRFNWQISKISNWFANDVGQLQNSKLKHGRTKACLQYFTPLLPAQMHRYCADMITRQYRWRGSCSKARSWVPSQYKDHLSQVWDSHVKDKTVVRPSYL